MHIQPGERIPEAILQFIEGGVHKVDTTTLFAHRRMVLISVPGAFTPTCSERHLPDYIAHFDAFQTRGIALACMAVNDPFVMQAWAREQHVPHGMRMLADGNAEFTRALGLEFDASGFGMGVRSRRFALYADDGIVRGLWVEAPGEYRVSTAGNVLAQLPA
ncbi:MAG: peroxiredoxin [Thermomonas sp.]|uniref:peroxiredoxin n=1 Tax=Thermomonas sp. TaxID=1971895 RepID=UPI00260751D3|nr:peroxiredoxin [Thermomonas sp.]MCC7095823.1 peroxiredoxin [Thermomonas sp.]